MAAKNIILHMPPAGPAGKKESSIGYFAVVGCFTWWGVVPLYWHLLRHAPLIEVIAYRCIWSLVLSLPILCLTGRLNELRAALAGRNLAILCFSALSLTTNWSMFIWSIHSGQVLEMSLGNFLGPLFSILAGVLIFKDQPRPLQWFGIFLAIVAVLSQVLTLGRFPWLAVGMAATSSLYACLRKIVRVESLPGLVVENIIVLLPTTLIAVWFWQTGQSAMQRDAACYFFLYMGAGFITSVPMTLYAYGIRHTSLVTLGILHYIVPTLSFIIALCFFQEPFTSGHALTFGLIWTAVLLYVFDSLRTWRAMKKTKK